METKRNKYLSSYWDQWLKQTSLRNYRDLIWNSHMWDYCFFFLKRKLWSQIIAQCCLGEASDISRYPIYHSSLWKQTIHLLNKHPLNLHYTNYLVLHEHYITQSLYIQNMPPQTQKSASTKPLNEKTELNIQYPSCFTGVL